MQPNMDYKLASLLKDERIYIKPLLRAFIIAGLFIVLSIFYIFISGQIAYQSADSATNLHKYESIKGIIYVSVTGLIIFFILFFSFRKIGNYAQTILNNNKALIRNEGQILAGLIASSLAHDINNLNQIILGNISLISESSSNLFNKEINEITNASNKLTHLTKNLSSVAGNINSDYREKVNIVQLIQDIITLSRKYKNVNKCTVIYDLHEDIIVSLNSQLFSRVVLNLIINAADSIEANGVIVIKLSKAKNEIVFEISDNGCGIPANLQKKIFEPFYTSKQNGTGLGLVSVKVFVQEHKGDVAVSKSELGGTSFTIKIPVSDQEI